MCREEYEIKAYVYFEIRM